MKPIINPWLIYLIDLFDNLKKIIYCSIDFTCMCNWGDINYLVFMFHGR